MGATALNRRQHPADDLDQYEGDERRDVDHSHGGDDAADGGDDRLRQVDKDALDRGLARRVEPGHDRAGDDAETEDRENKLDEAGDVAGHGPSASFGVV